MSLRDVTWELGSVVELGDFDGLVEQRALLLGGLGPFLHGLILDGLVKALEDHLGGVFDVGVGTGAWKANSSGRSVGLSWTLE